MVNIMIAVSAEPIAFVGRGSGRVCNKPQLHAFSVSTFRKYFGGVRENIN